MPRAAKRCAGQHAVTAVTGERLVEKLRGPDRRSIGRSEEVAADVLADPSLFPALFDAMLVTDPLVRMRAADAVEKLTRRRPEILQPYKSRLLDEVAAVPQHEVRWHVAQLIPRLKLTSGERERAMARLYGYLEDDSRIVRTFTMQALADLAADDAQLRGEVVPLLRHLTATGSPAMRSRGRALLAQLGAKPTQG